MQFFSEGEAHVRENWTAYLKRFPLASGNAAQRLVWPELNKAGLLYEEDLDYNREEGKNYLTGEASAATFADVEPSLLRRYLPDLQLIVILRDPVERAYSHHRMFLRFQAEGRDLPQHIGDFDGDMRTEMRDFEKGKPGELLPLGLYKDTLERWVDEWGRKRILVLFSAHLESGDTQPTLMERVRKHIGLSPWSGDGEHRPHHNQAPIAEMNAGIRAELYDFYKPYQAELRDYLQCELPWMPSP
jgi:hypothetical protein